MKQPWFHIIEIIEPRGRSMHDIIGEVAQRYHIRLSDLRGHRIDPQSVKARKEAILQIHLERPDLTSTQIAGALNRDSSSVRYHLRNLASPETGMPPAFEGFDL